MPDTPEPTVRRRRRHRDTEMVVVPHRPGHLWLRGAGLVLVVVALAAGAWRAGMEEGLRRGQAAMAELDELRPALAATAAEVQRLATELADLRLAERFDGSAEAEVRGAVRDLRGELADAEQELRFYRGLMSPGEDGGGLRIERLDLTATGEPGRVRWKLLLVQVEDKHEVVTGRVELDLVGRRNGEPEVLSWDAVAELGSYPLGFRFRYFQDLPGELRLPEGFRPEQVRVVADAANSGRLEKVFAWQVQEG